MAPKSLVEDMNNQLAEQQTEQAPTMVQALEQQTEQAPTMVQALELQIVAFNEIQAANNASIDESNSLLDENERLRDELSFSKLQLKILSGRIDELTTERDELSKTIETDNAMAKEVAKGQVKIMENAKKCLQQEKQAKLELEQAKLTIADLRRDNKALKEESKGFRVIASTPAKMRVKLADKDARLKKEKAIVNQRNVTIEELKTEIFKLKKSNLALNHKIAVSDLIEIHAYGEYLLCLFPHQLGDIDGYKNNQVPLLCLHKGGRGGVTLLNNNNEAEVPPAPKGGFRPPKPMLEHAGNFLRRVESQGWTMSDKDIQSLNMKHLAA